MSKVNKLVPRKRCLETVCCTRSLVSWNTIFFHINTVNVQIKNELTEMFKSIIWLKYYVCVTKTFITILFSTHSKTAGVFKKYYYECSYSRIFLKALREENNR